MDSLLNETKSLCVCSPQNNQFLQIVLLFEVLDVFPDGLEVLQFVVTLENMIGSGFLVSSDEVLIVNCGPWN